MNEVFGRREADSWKAEASRLIVLLLSAITILTATSKMFGIELVGGEATKARITANEKWNARQDTAIRGVQSDMGAVLQMTCRSTRRTDPDWVPFECDRVLSRTPR